MPSTVASSLPSGQSPVKGHVNMCILNDHKDGHREKWFDIAPLNHRPLPIRSDDAEIRFTEICWVFDISSVQVSGFPESKLNGPSMFWTWVWSLEDVQMFMKQREKVLNAINIGNGSFNDRHL